MAPPIPTSPPTAVRAGETWLWDDVYPDFPASEGWVLSYELRSAGTITIAAALTTVIGTGWRVTVPASMTAPYQPDSYEMVAVLTGSGTYAGRVHQISLPWLTILPNLILANVGDRVTFAQEAIARIEKAIAAREKGDQPEEYLIDGVSVKRIPLQQLYAVRLRLKEELREARAPTQFGRPVQHRFTVPAA